MTLPLIAPGILGGALLAFALSIDDFVISNFNSGQTETFPLFIFGAAQRGIPVQVYTLATILFAVTVLAMLFVTWQQKRAEDMAAVRKDDEDTTGLASLEQRPGCRPAAPEFRNGFDRFRPVIKGFKEFIMRGNVVDLAVGVVIGVAFTAVVTSMVEDLLTPLIAAIFGEPDFSALTFTINDSEFGYGNFINAVFSFFTVAAAVYFFVVVPMNRLRGPAEVKTRELPGVHDRDPAGGEAMPALHRRDRSDDMSEPKDNLLWIGGEAVAGDGERARGREPVHRGDADDGRLGLAASSSTRRSPPPARPGRSGRGRRPASGPSCCTRSRGGCASARTSWPTLMTREGGKPLIENRDEIGWSAAAFDYYAEIGRDSAGRVIPPIESTQLALVLKEPLGVGRLHRALELPAAAARLEAGAGARRRQHDRRQALRADAALDPRARAAASTTCPPASSTSSPAPGDVGAALTRRRARRRHRLHRLGRDRQEGRRSPAPSASPGSTSRWAARTPSSSAPTSPRPTTSRSPPAAAPGPRS